MVLAESNVIDGELIADCLDYDESLLSRDARQVARVNPSQWVDLKTLERDYLAALAETFAGNITKMASILGISERSLYRKLKDMKEVKDLKES